MGKGQTPALGAGILGGGCATNVDVATPSSHNNLGSDICNLLLGDRDYCLKPHIRRRTTHDYADWFFLHNETASALVPVGQ